MIDSAVKPTGQGQTRFPSRASRFGQLPAALIQGSEWLSYEQAQQLMPDLIKQTLSELIPGALAQWTRYLAQAPGKQLRAQMLLLAACQTHEQDGYVVNREALRGAVVLELIHLASLVHDDIIDAAASRRGQKTLHHLLGTRPAILVGDAILAAALKLATTRSYNLSDTDLLRRYVLILEQLCWGEGEEWANRNQQAPTLRAYLEIAAAKTAGLFESALAIGAQLSSENRSFQRQMAYLGHRLGLLFQMADDLHDFSGTGQHWGKPLGADLTNGVWSLPLVLYHHRRGMQSDDPVSPTQEALINSGMLTETAQFIQSYAQKTEALLGRIDLSDPLKLKWKEMINRAKRLPDVSNASSM